MHSMMGMLMAYLVGKADLLRIRADQIEVDLIGAWIERGGMDETERGVHLMDFGYTAVFSVARLPSGSLSLLLLLIVCWLSEHDGVRCDHELPWPDVEIHDMGSGMVDVLIDVEFIDQFFGGESEGGPLELNGRTFAPSSYQLAVAERGTVNEAPTETDA